MVDMALNPANATPITRPRCAGRVSWTTDAMIVMTNAVIVPAMNQSANATIGGGLMDVAKRATHDIAAIGRTKGTCRGRRTRLSSAAPTNDPAGAAASSKPLVVSD